MKLIGGIYFTKLGCLSVEIVCYYILKYYHQILIKMSFSNIKSILETNGLEKYEQSFKGKFKILSSNIENISKYSSSLILKI